MEDGEIEQNQEQGRRKVEALNGVAVSRGEAVAEQSHGNGGAHGLEIQPVHLALHPLKLLPRQLGPQGRAPHEGHPQPLPERRSRREQVHCTPQPPSLYCLRHVPGDVVAQRGGYLLGRLVRTGHGVGNRIFLRVGLVFRSAHRLLGQVERLTRRLAHLLLHLPGLLLDGVTRVLRLSDGSGRPLPAVFGRVADEVGGEVGPPFAVVREWAHGGGPLHGAVAAVKAIVVVIIMVAALVFAIFGWRTNRHRREHGYEGKGQQQHILHYDPTAHIPPTPRSRRGLSNLVSL